MRVVLIVFVLVIFVLGIMPKSYLHSVFAKHTDNKVGSKNGKPYQLTKSVYNCDCDNLVAESTFLHELPAFKILIFFSFSSYTFRNVSFFSATGMFSPLRGPPVRI